MSTNIPCKLPEMLHLDLIIPCLNEETSAPNLVSEIEKVANEVRMSSGGNIRLGVIIVDDGSSDNTQEVFASLLKGSKFFERSAILCLSRNFGKEAALNAGLQYCNGDACIILDADLQDPPSLLHTMIDAWLEGYKVVNAVRKDRSSDSFLKRFSARAFYTIFAKVSHLDIQFNASDFRLLDRAAIDSILACPERVRFSKGFFAWVGFKQKSIYFERPERLTGSSKWGGWKLWNYALDGIFNFSTAPLRIWSYIGISVTLASFCYGAYILFTVLTFGVDIPGYASIMMMITFLGGLQLAGIGIIGEYIGRIYLETKCRPHCIIREVIELSPD